MKTEKTKADYQAALRRNQIDRIALGADGLRPYCTQCDGYCDNCSLSSYGRDCHNNPIDIDIDILP
jgi:hypothetical protein